MDWSTPDPVSFSMGPDCIIIISFSDYPILRKFPEGLQAEKWMGNEMLTQDLICLLDLYRQQLDQYPFYIYAMYKKGNGTTKYMGNRMHCPHRNLRKFSQALIVVNKDEATQT